jgi:hypothetical protein
MGPLDWMVVDRDLNPRPNRQSWIRPQIQGGSIYYEYVTTEKTVAGSKTARRT